MSKFIEWVKTNKWFILAYIVFIVIFWFWKAQEMSATEAYFGLVCLHIVFLFIAWVAKNILKK